MSKENPNHGKPIPDLTVNDWVLAYAGDSINNQKLKVIKLVAFSLEFKTYKGNDGSLYWNSSGNQVYGLCKYHEIVRKIHFKS